MTTPLQDKDDQWRNRRADGARPVFDPGVAPLGVDDETGCSLAAAPRAPDEALQPLPLSPDAGGRGVKLSTRLWYGAAVVLGILLLIAGALSLA